MKIRNLMTTEVQTCRPSTTLGEAGLTMWRNDCGIVPVVDDGKRVVGVITDRDICMGLATTGAHPYERTVGEVMSGKAITIPQDATVMEALETMKRERVRRLPVVDPEGALVGLVSLNDLVEHAELATGRGELRGYAPELIHTLKAICAHPSSEPPSPKRARVRPELAHT